jgi:hypothetical protein
MMTISLLRGNNQMKSKVRSDLPTTEAEVLLLPLFDISIMEMIQ